MAITFEAIREAGIRLPKAVGQSVSIVGALVIGNAATQAGLVSTGAVITVAFAGIASFTNPSYALGFSNRVLQFGFMIMSSLYGFYGFILTGLALVAHLVSLQSFGVPYMSPMAPFVKSRFLNAFYRPPWSKLNSTHQSVSPFPKPKLGESPNFAGKGK
jgi:spore germination protein KA